MVEEEVILLAESSNLYTKGLHFHVRTGAAMRIAVERKIAIENLKVCLSSCFTLSP